MWWKLFFSALALYSAASSLSINPKQNFDPEKVKHEIIEYIRTGVKPEAYEKDVVASMKIGRVFRRGEKSVENDLLCASCAAVADAVIAARKLLGASKQQLQNIVQGLCVDLNVETEAVCEGTISSNIDIFLYVIDNKDDILGSRVCSIVLQKYECKSTIESNWEIEIPEGYSPPSPNVPSGVPFQIIHFSDFHIDNLYTPGGNALCDEPLCCQSDQGGPSSEAAACGYWGDHRSSDSPIHAVENSVDQAVGEHPDANFLYYTGDIVSHRVWSTSIEGNQQDMKRVYELLGEKFNGLVFPVLGNHEPHPLNVWSPESVTTSTGVSTQWVFDLVADEWSRWLPSYTRETILKGGYYSVLVRPRFRVIGINSNVCYTSNWFLLYDDEDPFDQLKWLVNELLQAETNRESVHILTHIPTSDSNCYRIWSQQYRRIVERFANTITGQFNGHTHDDIFSIYYNSSQPTQAINKAFNGASVVTYTNRNPSYKLYYVDDSSFEISDYDEWSYNLTEANLTPNVSPRWFKLYSFKEAYGVEDLSPESLDELVERFARDKSLLEQYYRFKVRGADTALQSGCNDSCHKKNLCSIVTSAFGDSERCAALQEVYDEIHGSK